MGVHGGGITTKEHVILVPDAIDGIFLLLFMADQESDPNHHKDKTLNQPSKQTGRQAGLLITIQGRRYSRKQAGRQAGARERGSEL